MDIKSKIQIKWVEHVYFKEVQYNWYISRDVILLLGLKSVIPWWNEAISMVKSARCCFHAQDLIKEGIEFTASPTALTLWQNSIILPISVMYFTGPQGADYWSLGEATLNAPCLSYSGWNYTSCLDRKNAGLVTDSRAVPEHTDEMMFLSNRKRQCRERVFKLDPKVRAVAWRLV